VESDKKELAMTEVHRCLQCGAELARDVAQGLCPKCLLKVGLGARTDAGDAPPVTFPSRDSPPVRPHAAPEVGELFGPYRLVRLLGKGGMGAVYEAEHLESERRVALKVLSHSLDSPEARGRFLREGRLAASVNHPNSVYIYGTEEVEGTPVIAMEMVPGETLADRVRRQGPMPVAEAVDAILQIIEGLEAAQAVGVLHRDIKPSNCFVEAGGTVKVGDFGLSISTKAREEIHLTTTGTFLGTPAFASPEQLKGDELDVRSDIYAVGVTLYYLLTGKTPFHGDNLIRFIARALEQPAASPATFRRNIPKGLCAAVLRCLEKQPARRFRNYGELREALLPYASAAPTPATLGWRFLAYILDMVIWSGLTGPLGYVVITRIGSPIDPATYQSPFYIASVLTAFALVILYFALTEGIRGASVGKMICALRVVGPGRSAPGVARALLRAAIFILLPVLPLWIYLGFDPAKAATLGTQAGSMVIAYSQFVVTALMFVISARRRNGFAGLHDLASGTRVIRKAAYEARPSLEVEEPPQPVSESTPQIGPYYVLDSLEKTQAGELLLGYDSRLLRRVWIRRLPEGTRPAPATVRGLGRATRLRWLGGTRTAGENWDAYEAPAGMPLLALVTQTQPWRSVRHWLMDLAEELAAGLKDGSVPAALALDRVWITSGGRAKLLDFPAPGTGGAPLAAQGPAQAAADFGAARAFLNQVAVAALDGRIVDADAARGKTPAAPVPLHARKFLTVLPTSQGPEDLAAGLKPLLQKVASVTRRRRFGLVLGCAFLPILMAGATLFGLSMARRFMEQQPDIMPLQVYLMHLSVLEKQSANKDNSKERQALEVYIAGRFGKTISDPVTWTSLIAQGINEGRRAKARLIVAKHPNPSEQEFAEAKAVAEPLAGGPDMAIFLGGRSLLPAVALQAGIATLLLALLSIFCALVFRSGLAMRVLGVVAVRRNGSRAGRLRVFWRALVTWLPFVLGSVGLVALGRLLYAKPAVSEDIVVTGTASALALALFAALAIVSALLPERGIQDRLAGTWLVPR
jgi:hypothetical protein